MFASHTHPPHTEWFRFDVGDMTTVTAASIEKTRQGIKRLHENVQQCPGAHKSNGTKKA
jgi:hypothetical protein